MHGESASDAQLMARVGGGDPDALERLVRRHQAGALSLAYRILARWDLAEEVGCEAFVQVARAAKQEGPPADFEAWLDRVVVNLCFDEKRRRERAAGGPREAFPADGEQDTSMNIDGSGAGARSPSAGALANAVGDAVFALPIRQRTMLVLHRYRDRSLREIAYITCCSLAAVQSLLVRGYENLQKTLPGRGEKTA